MVVLCDLLYLEYSNAIPLLELLTRTIIDVPQVTAWWCIMQGGPSTPYKLSAYIKHNEAFCSTNWLCVALWCVVYFDRELLGHPTPPQLNPPTISRSSQIKMARLSWLNVVLKRVLA